MGKYTQLSMQDRCHLYTLYDMGVSILEIAQRMNRHCKPPINKTSLK